ncbi:MAG: DUF3592 domain-containing protein [Cellvibrionaceae bacterium]
MELDYLIQGLGVLLVCLGIYNLRKIKLRVHWPSTEARITTATAEVDSSEHIFINPFNKYKPVTKKTITAYHPKLRYQYEVGELTIIGSNLFSAPLWATSFSDILPYTDGSTHTVWYNPENSVYSYLKSSSRFASCFWGVVGVLLIIYPWLPLELLMDLVK